MRLTKYIIEESEYSLDDVLKYTNKNFLTIIKKNDFIYRGSKPKNKDIIKLVVRKNRQPRDIDFHVHMLMDDLFKQKFGWKARSEGVFVCSDPYEASVYGSVYLFFPIGSYKFIWSKKIRDLFRVLVSNIPKNISVFVYFKREYEEEYMGSRTGFYTYLYDKHKDKFKEYLEKVVIPLYTDKNLQEVFKYRSEISFKCKEYFLVNVSYKDKIREMIKNE
jgi:hypothetical protein